MSATITSSGLQTETFEEIKDSLVDMYAQVFGITDIQRERIRDDLESTAGQLVRIWAEQEYRHQEALQQVYNSLGWSSSGANLDRAVALLGVSRNGAIASQVSGTAAGTAGVEIPEGTRIQFDDDSTIWEVTDGPYTIGGGGTVTILLNCQTYGAIEAAPSSNWTIIDTVVNFDSFASVTQTVTGAAAETDAELRARAQQEAFRRAMGPLEAIEAQVAGVTGVTYVKAWENTTLSTDADGIPGKAINVVVEGGVASDIAAAIYRSRPAGIQMYGTDESEEIDLGLGRIVTIGFDRVSDVDIYVDVDLQTSTSEENPPVGIATTVDNLVAAYIETLDIGQDVLSYKIIGHIHAQNYPGIDAITVTVDRTPAPAASKEAISLRERARGDAARVTVTTS